MSEITNAEAPAEQPKSSLRRKVLIVTAATVGLFIAGGFAVLKRNASEDEIVEPEQNTDA